MRQKIVQQQDLKNHESPLLRESHANKCGHLGANNKPVILNIINAYKNQTKCLPNSFFETGEFLSELGFFL